jgi:UDP-N-acetylglucosamine:LPS N-acetylglucosamine transferase
VGALLLPNSLAPRAHRSKRGGGYAPLLHDTRPNAIPGTYYAGHDPAPRVKTLDVVYFDAGGGHRAAAMALQSALVTQGWSWRVRLVHLFEVLDSQGQFRRLTGFAPEDYYNKRLARGWTLGLAQELKVLQGMIKLGHGVMVKILQQHWARTEPDLVVSLIPNFNRVLYESLAAALPRVPYVTLMTDLADLPPHFWIEPDQHQDLICGTPHAAEQACAAGYPPERVHAVSGMLLRSDFYTEADCDRAEERRQLGLDPDLPTGLVLFGGHGSSAMATIAKGLRDTQLILMCGHNAALAKRLQTTAADAPRCIVGFTKDVPRYMRLADFFIGKPGPGSISEAVHMGLPVIVTRNALTMPQERYNTVWVRDNHVGIVLPSFRAIRPAVADLIGGLDRFKAATARLKNRAAFEIPERLALILARSERFRAQATAVDAAANSTVQ